MQLNGGSGAELDDQRIILTAAHVLDANTLASSSPTPAPLNAQSVTYNLQNNGAPVNISIPVASNPANLILPTVANAGAGMAWNPPSTGGSLANDIGLVGGIHAN